MKLWHKRLAIGAAVVIGLTPATVSALDLTIPALIPDPCGFFGFSCTFTHDTALLEVQQVLAAAENLKAAHGIATTIAIVRGQIPEIQAAIAAHPTHAGDVAAATVTPQVPAVNEQIVASGDTAAGCTGDLCVAQANAATNAVTASEVTKANTMHANEVGQNDIAEVNFANALVEEFGPDAHLPAELQ